MGDSFRLKQIISNLLGNAIKFTKKGHIIIGVKRIENQDDNGVTLEFLVKDTGIGIPKDKVDVLFRRFSQADDSNTRQYEEGSSFFFTCVLEMFTTKSDINDAELLLRNGLRLINSNQMKEETPRVSF